MLVLEKKKEQIESKLKADKSSEQAMNISAADDDDGGEDEEEEAEVAELNFDWRAKKTHK